MTAEVRGGDVERVCLDSLWDRDAHLRWCVRGAPKPLLMLLLTVRARGSSECGGGEETREGGEEEGEREEERDTTAWLKGCIGFMQGRLISGLTAKGDLLGFYVIGGRRRFRHAWSRLVKIYMVVYMCIALLCGMSGSSHIKKKNTIFRGSL